MQIGWCSSKCTFTQDTGNSFIRLPTIVTINPFICAIFAFKASATPKIVTASMAASKGCGT